MAKKDPKVAKRYARALFYVVPPDQYDRAREALSELERCWNSTPELRQALQNPVVSAEQREQVLRELCQRIQPNSEQFRGFAQLLLRNDRLNVLSEVTAAFADLVRKAQKIMAVEITSAFALSDEERGAMQHRLEEQLHSAVVVTWQVDADILGGLIIRSADKLVDGSVRGTLERLGSSLAAR